MPKAYPPIQFKRLEGGRKWLILSNHLCSVPASSLKKHFNCLARLQISFLRECIAYYSVPVGCRKCSDFYNREYNSTRRRSKYHFDYSLRTNLMYESKRDWKRPPVFNRTGWKRWNVSITTHKWVNPNRPVSWSVKPETGVGCTGSSSVHWPKFLW